nr:MAG TPA: hypothetical protein [Caudoviricetes sp.]DAY56916.1 MAG TPA: hypothetical protein [Caudoviricetes sp.]
MQGKLHRHYILTVSRQALRLHLQNQQSSPWLRTLFFSCQALRHHRNV